MSLYLYTEKLEDLFKNTEIEYTFVSFDPDYVIAHHKNHKLYYKDYDENNLKSFVNKYNDCVVSKYFWNINYCKNINVENKKLDENMPYVDLNTYFAGRSAMHIGCLSIILELYKCDDYISFVNDLVIDKNVFTSFLCSIDYVFPLTNKFLALLEFIFDSSNIIDYIFKNNRAKYNYLQTKTILENINFDSINHASKYVFTLNISKGNKLLYIHLLLELYQQPIDITEIVYISNAKKTEYLGYYLLTFDVPQDLVNLYIEVIKLYYDKNGSVCYKIVDNPNIETEFRKNEKIIKDILQIKCDP